MANQNSTLSFVEINDIRDTLVLLKDGSLRTIIEVESVNFDLKSNDEQIGILRGFQDFLNAVDFPVQIIVHSRKLNLVPYLEYLDTTFHGLTNELLRVQATEYSKFIKGISELANIMDKRFFITIPYYAMEAPAVAAMGWKDRIKSVVSAKKPNVTILDAELEKYEERINQRVSLIISALSPLGLTMHVLGQKELMDLYTASYGNKTT